NADSAANATVENSFFAFIASLLDRCGGAESGPPRKSQCRGAACRREPTNLPIYVGGTSHPVPHVCHGRWSTVPMVLRVAILRKFERQPKKLQNLLLQLPVLP